MGKLALPIGEICRFDSLELEGNRRVVEHRRDENPALRALRRFCFHPARRDRMLRPQNNDAASRLQRTVDRLVERLPRRNLSVPPYRPAIVGKYIGEQFSLILVYSRIADENITHLAMMIAYAREFNPNCALHVAGRHPIRTHGAYSSGKVIAKLRSLRA